MTNGNREAELVGLMELLREDRLSAADAQRLERMVCDDDAARRRYVHYMRMVADLQWVASRRSGRDLLSRLALAPDPLLPNDSPISFDPPPVAPPNLFSRWGLGGGWIDAAPVVVFGVLMLVAGLFVGLRMRSPKGNESAASVERAAESLETPVPIAIDEPEPAVATIARLVRTVDCQWDNSSLPTQAGSEWSAGQVRLSRGRALIRFESGAEVLLEGPSVFQLDDASRGSLLSGQLVARVPVEAVGFAIKTPTATVVDLGTEFGVVADARGATEVHVFDGAVELYAGDDDQAALRVVAGEARRLASAGDGEPKNWSELPLDDARFVRNVDAPTLPLEIEGQLLLADDFRGPELDDAHWKVVTQGVPSLRANVRQRNGRIELINRGHLVTRSPFVPGEGGTLRIRGRFTLSSPRDMFQILTRSDGRPRADSYGDTTNGVECFVNLDAGGVMGIYGRGEVRLQETFALLEIKQGETFDFELLDSGTNVTFTVRKVGGDGASATVSTYCDHVASDNLIVLHNRESRNEDRVATVEHLVIERLPVATDGETAEEDRPRP